MIQICWLILKYNHALINYSGIIQKRRKRSRKSRNAWKQFYYVTLNKDKTCLCSICKFIIRQCERSADLWGNEAWFRCPWRNIRLTWSRFDLKETVARPNKPCRVVLCQCKIIEKSVCQGWICCFLPRETRSSTRFSITCSLFAQESRLAPTVNLLLDGTVILTLPSIKAGQWESQAYWFEGCPILTTYFTR